METPISVESDRLAWTLRPDRLQVGDIILSTQNHWKSFFIRFATGMSPFSHAALYLGGGFVMEAVTEGVRRVHVRHFLYEQRGQVRVLRPRDLSPEVAQQVSLYARSMLYRPYSVVGAVQTKVPVLTAQANRGLFCSQLVAASYLAADCPLLEKAPSKVTPADFEGLDSLCEDVTHEAIRKVSFGSFQRAVEGLRPSMKAVPGSPQNEPFIEKDFLNNAKHILEKHPFLEQPSWVPYNFMDLLRQLREQVYQHPDTTYSIDQEISEKLGQCGVYHDDRHTQSMSSLVQHLMQFEIEPLSFDFDPTVSTLETEVDLREFTVLCQDLRASKTWDIEDWKHTVEEYKNGWNQTHLRCLGATYRWLLRDYSIVENNYWQLDKWTTLDPKIINFPH